VLPLVLSCQVAQSGAVGFYLPRSRDIRYRQGSEPLFSHNWVNFARSRRAGNPDDIQVYGPIGVFVLVSYTTPNFLDMT
jgi:hypothetical protein